MSMGCSDAGGSRDNGTIRGNHGCKEEDKPMEFIGNGQ